MEDDKKHAGKERKLLVMFAYATGFWKEEKGSLKKKGNQINKGWNKTSKEERIDAGEKMERERNYQQTKKTTKKQDNNNNNKASQLITK